MAYGPYYYITDWENEPSQKTLMNRTNLLKIENGIKEADNRIVQIDANKADKSTINTLADDAQKVIDLTRFVYSVDCTATVAMQIQGRTITATISP
jgi:GH25 family lysozyme M1 (1,4-beta-N-acetylmuramidase)